MPRRYLPFIVILLFAFAVRMWDIDARSLWFDEAVEYWSAEVSLPELPRTAVSALQPPLFSFLLHFWSHLGTTAIWLRTLSVFLSVLAVLGTMLTARLLFGVKAGMVAGLITAVMPSEIRYAQEVGEYALVGCALTWSLAFLVQAPKYSRWRYWILWGCCSIASVYSHYGAALVVFATGLVSWLSNLWRKDQQSFIRQSMVAISGLLFAVPLSLPLMRQFHSTSEHVVVPASRSVVAEIGAFVISIGDTFLFHLTGWPYSQLPKYIGLILIGLVFFLWLVTLVWGSLRRTSCWWLLASYTFYYLTVRLGLYAYGVFGFRYALVLTPLLILAIVAVVEQLRRKEHRWLASGLVGALLALSVLSLPNRTLSDVTRRNLAWPETQDMREIVDYWARYRHADEPTYVYYGAVPAFRYYLQQRGLETAQLPALWYSHCWSQSAPDYCRTDNIFYGSWIRNRSPEMKLDSIWKTLGIQPSRLWLVFSHVYPGERESILRGLSEAYQVSLTYERSGAVVYLVERR